MKSNVLLNFERKTFIATFASCHVTTTNFLEAARARCPPGLKLRSRP
uniref:Uncharacterized protein n=1 Tax=Anguilla anguilla TaxID=7936 RepID=A0A0E9WDT8_ANGAN